MPAPPAERHRHHTRLSDAQTCRSACVYAAARVLPGDPPLVDDLLAIARYVETGAIPGDTASSSGPEGDGHAPPAAG
ncbi:hypothetical protein L3Q67_38315 [Saccharothrix sp. AJ9571]|nr:hypothetical protein L3Q67_38315 [Saccharothrix sp. AJ9571]